MLNNYLLGILYGDGYIQIINNRETVFFSTTHKEIADKLVSNLSNYGIIHNHYTRNNDVDSKKENYEILEVIQITDPRFLQELKECGYASSAVEARIKFDSDFLRGYMESKGTFFKSHSRGSEFWRISISGNYEDLTYIKKLFETNLGIKVGEVLQRREREAYGVYSNSYRLSTQSRDAVTKIIQLIKGEEISTYLKEKIKGFDRFHANTPFNAKRRVFKHYRNATLAMARELGLTIKGIRGSTGTKGFRAIFLWEADCPVLCFKGWEGAYKWVSKEYEKSTGYRAPMVESAD
ncbi:hypothetical protein SAMN05216238_101261 [Lentibacillus persicus]|uniref:DOD-type homing endonuclease domain-containing protein n=1 Tax=Lentibacillus persicus TaxID=640948 RepID=A0A1I1SBV7_9BACI|nr:LAGLIDADG family homing endonuclease [Lentibacillus persicus]SFD42078.1 hypothetical protein SAMN05216238_101261 [Lentibacillus persicus]